MDLFSPVDLYCERTDPSFLSEPLNFTTNLAFVVAGLLVVRSLRRFGDTPGMPGSYLLAILVVIIGIGSGLFHSFANRWSQACDIIPISLFLLVYLWLFFRHVVGARVALASLGLIGFTIISLMAAAVADPLAANGGQWYFGTWITLFGVSCFYGGRQKSHNQMRMALAAFAFSVSIFLRSVDMSWCEQWPIGTHFFWHLLNAFVLYLVTTAYITEGWGKPDARTREG